MKKLTKRNDLGRKIRSFKKHSWLLLQPFGFALSMSLFWWITFFKNGIHFNKEDEGPLLTGVFLLLSVTYGITTSATFESVWKKYQVIVTSVLKKDKHTFLCYRDERMPIVIHLLVIAFSIPLLGIVCLVEYHTASAGFVAVFATSFVLSLYWVVIAELQDPSKSLWFAERIPEQWLMEDIDQYFRLGEQNGRN